MEQLNWKVTKKDNSVVSQFNGNVEQKYDLKFEEANAIKKFELIGDKDSYSVDLESGEFVLNGKKHSPKDKGKNLQLVFKKRRQVRSEQGTILNPPRTQYIFGYKLNGKEIVMNVQPALGQLKKEEKLPN